MVIFFQLGEDLSSVQYEVVFDEPFLGGVPLRYESVFILRVLHNNLCQ